MNRFRTRRRRAAALVLLPAAAIPLAAAGAGVGSAAASTQPTLSAGRGAVAVGHPFRLTGTVPGRANVPVAIGFNPAGSERGWRQVAHARTHAHGGFGTRVRPRATGTYRAHPANGTFIGPVGVRVLSRTRATIERHAVIGNPVRIAGHVRPGDAGRRVVVRVGSHRMHTHTRRHGAFAVTWHPSSTGRFTAHVVARRDVVAGGSSQRAGRSIVFRRAVASWYGGGGTTACGQTLTSSTLGVANKTLPCGTRVTLRYHGNQVTVPVIDRGPYVAGRDYDLTEATKERLGFGDVGTILATR